MIDTNSLHYKLLEKFKAGSVPHFANDNISKHLTKSQLATLRVEVEEKVQDLMRALLIDVDNDHNTRGTAKRVAKMYFEEVFRGRYYPEPSITSFPNVKKLDEMICVGPIDVKSACSHHLVPIVGHAYVAVIPEADGTIIGLSKFNRIVEHYSRRPQIQEELCCQIADFLEGSMKPKGVAVYIKAKHMCMSWRGVEQESWTVTTVLRGVFKSDNGVSKQEFLSYIKD